MFRVGKKLGLLVRAKLLCYDGKFEEAIVLCSSHLREFSESASIHCSLGLAHFCQKRYLQAYWCFRTALSRASSPDAHATLSFFLGVSAYHLGRNQLALEALGTYCRQVGPIEQHLNPFASLVKAYYYMGYAHLKQASLQLAAQCFERVLASGAMEDVSVVVDLASIYCTIEVARFQDAIRILRTHLTRFPEHVELRKALSYAYSLLGENGAALRQAMKGLLSNPDDRWLHQQLAYLYMQKDVLDFEGALREVEQLLLLDPKNTWASEFRWRLQISRPGAATVPSHLRLVDSAE